MHHPPFSKELLVIDCKQECDRILRALGQSLRTFRKRGFVVGVSGGIDSSVTLALCARAAGGERTLALQMPERHSDGESLTLGALVIDKCATPHIRQDISALLEAAGFYRRYDEVVRALIPGYGDGWKSKLVFRNAVKTSRLPYFSITARSPDGEIITRRLDLKAYLEIVAATNFKQRIRAMLEYYHADRCNYIVAGTPNILEHDLGFFVKHGDGAADVKPIAHLYKTQVYQLAEYLGIPAEIRSRPPTTDTYSMEQGQDEFFFSLPYDKMDLCLWGKITGYNPEEVAPAIGLTPEAVAHVYTDIDAKQHAARYLHASPVMV
ncbi:MAG: NAD(+) synthase [Chitinispirillaceae bacterium]|jgi:NAD+ synthase|nr:NAD(+) synthase [Chitinispirillaceae bacterium]